MKCIHLQLSHDDGRKQVTWRRALCTRGDLAPILAEANEGVRLHEMPGDLFPSVEWFVYAPVGKDAVLSGQIEGTQATLMDPLEVEASGEVAVDADVAEVCGYFDARHLGQDHLGRADGQPLPSALGGPAGSAATFRRPGDIFRRRLSRCETRPACGRSEPRVRDA